MSNKEKLTSKQKKQQKKERLSSMTSAERKKYYLKKSIIITALVLVILAAVYAVMGLVLKKVTETGSFIEQLEEVYPTYTPFPAEWGKDLSTDSDYLSLNTKIMYGEGDSSSLYSLEDFYSQKTPGQRFFVEYFRILREGDYESYSRLFSDRYKKVSPSKRFEKDTERQFPPQRVHDITVRLMFSESGTQGKKECLRSVYHVDYKINRNSNLFRNDIGWNPEYSVETSRPLYFELITFDAGTENEKTYINNMYTESTVKALAESRLGTED